MPSTTPRPGARVRGSASGRPVMVLLDLLGRRGTLRVLWELRGSTAHTFRSLQESAGGMSPSVLNDRLRELRELGVVDASEAGYVLTPAGRELARRLKPLDAWATEWAAALAPTRRR